MIRILLVLSLLPAVACSDDSSSSDLGPDKGVQDRGAPDGYIRCPANKPIDGHACTLPATDPPCDYPIESCPCGPSDLEWRCVCELGKWKCSRDYDCYPCTDGAVDGTTDIGTTFGCGDQQSCKIGEEYCMKTTPGVCGGLPVPDSGLCPPDCQPTFCGEDVCLCHSYSCFALPSGCGDCSCLGLGGGACAFTCSDNGGAIMVTCAMP